MPPRRYSGSNRNNGNSNPHQPPKKRRIPDPETAVALDPNAIDHSLDLAPPDDPVAKDPSHLDSFSLSLFEEELNVATDAVMPTLVDHHHGDDDNDAGGHPAEAEAGDEGAEGNDEDAVGRIKIPKKKKAKRRSSGQAPQSTPQKIQPAGETAITDIEEIKRIYGTARLERIRRQAIKDAWKEYKEETSRVVKQLPEEITSMFGQIGYGKFGKKWFPLLLICPFGKKRQHSKCA